MRANSKASGENAWMLKLSQHLQFSYAITAKISQSGANNCNLYRYILCVGIYFCMSKTKCEISIFKVKK